MVLSGPKWCYKLKGKHYIPPQHMVVKLTNNPSTRNRWLLGGQNRVIALLFSFVTDNVDLSSLLMINYWFSYKGVNCSIFLICLVIMVNRSYSCNAKHFLLLGID